MLYESWKIRSQIAFACEISHYFVLAGRRQTVSKIRSSPFYTVPQQSLKFVRFRVSERREQKADKDLQDRAVIDSGRMVTICNCNC